jgi:glycerophosphoryl diester phosphodiesterase
MLVADAHAAGLAVHPYAFQAENQFLPPDLRTGTDPNGYGWPFTEQADITLLSRSFFAAD